MMHLCLLFFALLFLLPYCPLADVIHQWPRSIAVVQGGEAEINCYQNGTARDNMLWYQQSAGQGLTIIGYIYRSSKAEYEDGFKTGFEITRTMNDKMSSLKIQSVNPSNAADYFCAASDGSKEAYFGDGTRLVVLEHEIQDPKVVVFQPSPEEIQKKEKATVVCLVTGFYPDNIYIHWLVDGKKKDSKDTSIHTDSNSIAGEGGKHYSISSRLRFEAKDWAVSKNVLCEVEHYQIGSKHETFKANIDIKAEICGVSKEEKMQSMGTAKLSYLILICKSILYATFISILAWKTKASYSKRFD